jgi:hypothetical protein
MLNLSSRKGSDPFLAYIKTYSTSKFLMSTIFLEKDADSIYEELEENISEEYEEEYREDRMDQMISRYGY